jgi:putative glutamine amidotransferase
MHLEALFVEQRRPLMRRLQRMVGDPETAADLCQETFARAWRSAPRDAPAERQRGWLHRTAHNLALDELRRARLRDHGPLDQASWIARDVEPAERLAVREAVAALRPHDRFVLLLRFAAGLSHAEIGELLDVGEEAARKRATRARAAFTRAYRASRRTSPPTVLLLEAGLDPAPDVAWLERAGARVRPLHAERFRAELATADALVVSGGLQDIHPAAYGEPVLHAEGPLDLAGDLRDLRALREALAFGVPVIGICRGHQLLNVALGGTLQQELERSAEHRRDAHAIATFDGTRARSVVGRRALVGSRHHQAVGRLGRGLQPTARSRDGVIEAVELAGRRFAIGLQWHPELGPSAEAGDRVAAALVAAALERAA